MSRGYSVAVQDVRGKFRSEGATEFGIHEVEDGYDTLEWIAAQPWCDGSIVMLGDSYFGMTQLCAVISKHPALKAVSPRLTGTGLSTVVHYEDGMQEAEQTARRGYFSTHYVENNTYYWEKDWSARPLERRFEDFFQALGRRSPEYDYELQHPDAHRGPTLERLLGATPVPMLFTAGWYDNCAIWSWPNIEAMQKSERWAPHLWLQLEAIDHENIHFDVAVARDDEEHAGLAARVAKMFAPTIDFYDYHLGGTSQEPARAVFEVVHGQTASAASWPPVQATSLTLFGSVGETADVRQLASAPDVEAAAGVTWASDSKNFVSSIADNPFSLLAHPRRDLAADAARDDVVTFDGAPLQHDLTLAGPVELEGVLNSNRVSTNLFARLLDVSEQGHATLISRGQIHLAEVNDETSFKVRMLHAGYRMQVGHRLRLHLASSDFPEHVPNPGTGESGWSATEFLPSETTISTAALQPLKLTLTVLN